MDEWNEQEATATNVDKYYGAMISLHSVIILCQSQRISVAFISVQVLLLYLQHCANCKHL